MFQSQLRRSITKSLEPTALQLLRGQFNDDIAREKLIQKLKRLSTNPIEGVYNNPEVPLVDDSYFYDMKQA